MNNYEADVGDAVGKCQKCGAPLAMSSRTGKNYCSAFCWLPEGQRPKKSVNEKRRSTNQAPIKDSTLQNPSDSRYNPYETKISLQDYWKMHSNKVKFWVSACIHAANSYISDVQFAGAQGEARDVSNWTAKDISAMKARADALFIGLFNNPPFITRDIPSADSQRTAPTQRAASAYPEDDLPF